MNKYIYLILRIIVAIILIQTLRYKFLAHPDSIYIFSKLGMEPAGRIGTGILELVASILILVPKTVWVGAGLAACILAGAILMHLTVLGIEVRGDGGKLFLMALGTFLLSAMIFWHERKKVPFISTGSG